MAESITQLSNLKITVKLLKSQSETLISISVWILVNISVSISAIYKRRKSLITKLFIKFYKTFYLIIITTLIDLSVFKNSVILNNSDNWLLWINNIKVQTSIKSIWNYINSDLKEKPALFRKSKQSTAYKINSYTSTIINFFTENWDIWRDWIKEYNIQIREYNKIFNNIL